jgi:hypothetical protein
MLSAPETTPKHGKSTKDSLSVSHAFPQINPCAALKKSPYSLEKKLENP